MIDPQGQLTEKSVVEEESSRWSHFFLVICLAFCCSFLVWAWFGELDVVSMADGRVVPSSRIKEVQHLEGGIVSEILFTEGEQVNTDQPLLVLEGTASDANAKELEVRTVALVMDIARLEAMLDGHANPVFPEELAKSHSRLIEQAFELFNLQMTKFRSDLAGREELVKQRKGEINALETRVINNQSSLDLLRQQIAISAELLKDQLTTEYRHLNFLREEADLNSKIDEDKAQLTKAISQLEEAEENLRWIRLSFREKVGEELKSARQELGELSERLKKFKDSQRRSVIRSPVDGIIKTTYVNTVGGVVSAGQVVLTIVPTDDTLVVEGRLPVQDIGYVQEGQEAVVKLASRDARRYGNLKGKVIGVSPDAVTTSDGQTFYPVRIRTEQDYFSWRTERYPLVPGMQLLAYIHTGKRTVLEYLLDPYVDSMGQAMQER
ncbi:MAG: HlyD family type I secretion periplasmic adaptor subunit [Proteobacteria bacterium]|nr:HlyD family type I secretion periplasmic adaptor subunit [Pseudomonadota bacterium]MBU1716356.1 HlyD family type I secretion periplasmic adaptor subunit [Pseudomonadota bacterium]